MNEIKIHLLESGGLVDGYNIRPSINIIMEDGTRFCPPKKGYGGGRSGK